MAAASGTSSQLVRNVDPNLLIATMRGQAQSDARSIWRPTSNDFVAGVTGAEPFSPLQPLRPFFESIGARSRDYQIGINIRPPQRDDVDSKAITLATFDELRFFSRSVDMLRIMLETRKDQIASFPWLIKYRDEDKHKDNDTNIQKLTAFFRFPDPIRHLNFKGWIRKIVEDMLVIDAPSIYVQRNKDQSIAALVPIDGATVRPLVDAQGMNPTPAPSASYQQWIHGVPNAMLSTDDLIYYPRNVCTYSMYGYSPVEQIITTLNMAIRRQLSQIQYYTDSNEPRGFLEMQAESTTTDVEQTQDWLDKKLTGNMAERRKILVVQNGVKYTDLRAEELSDKFDEWLVQLICAAFSVSPQSFLFQRTNRAGGQTQADQMRQEGLWPLLIWVKDLMDLIIQVYFGVDYLEWSWEPQEDVDGLKQAQIDQIYFRNGIRSSNAIAVEQGEDPVPGGDERILVLGTTAIRVAEFPNLPAPPDPAAQAAATLAAAQANAKANAGANGNGNGNGKPPVAANGGKQPPKGAAKPPAKAAPGAKAAPAKKRSDILAEVDFVKVGDLLIPSPTLMEEAA